MGCKRCGNCCRYHVFETWQFKHDMEWLAMKDGRISKGLALIPSVCKHLVGNDCSIYDKRPPFCMDWPGRYEDCSLKFLDAIECRFFEEERQMYEEEFAEEQKRFEERQS